MVRGLENGKTAVNFEQWLIPLEAITQALKIKTRTLDNGQLELRSSFIIKRLSEQQLQHDKELGATLSVADISKLLGITVTFDIRQYALIFKLPLSTPTLSHQNTPQKIISFEGLETIEASALSFSAISQQLRIQGQKDKIHYRGNLLAVGNVGQGSWYVDINQEIMEQPDSWTFQELQYYWKSDEVDYVVGSQPTFWQSSDFWGVTILKRNGFETIPDTTGGFDPSSRRTTQTILRTITGEANPNTLVRLVKRFSTDVIDEVLVDSNGLYTFNKVLSNPNAAIDYEILLYPDGILSVEPTRIKARFISRASQLQHGASTFIVSGGVSRIPSDNLWGDVSGFSGGVSYRYGLFESFTFGVGVIYQTDWSALAEFFYSPSWFPLQVNAIARKNLKTGRLDYNAQATLQLHPRFSINFASNPLSKQAFLNWNPWSWLTFQAGAAMNSSTTATVSANTWFVSSNLYRRFYNTFASLSLHYDSNAILRLNSSLYRDAWFVNYQHDDKRDKLKFSYNFSDSSFSKGNEGHSLNVGLETRKNKENTDYFGTARWRYRAKKRLNDGRNLFDAEIGYGKSSAGQGMLGKLSTRIIPGVELSMNYQDISMNSNERRFSLNINTNFKIAPHLSTSNRSRAIQDLRGSGGLFIQPFFDKNGNGKYDGNDRLYMENIKHLIQL
ncbi:MAG: hypothetical protein KAG26_07045, partial [Methylococcales bacterium]|nr:hypothetical protein [Methylococcales bacterium]